MINNPINKDTQISCSAIKDIYQRKFIKKKPCIILIITFAGSFPVKRCNFFVDYSYGNK